MVEVTDNAYAATVQIVQNQRDWVKVKEAQVKEDPSDLNYDVYYSAKDELAVMERIMQNLGLDC